MTSKPHIDAHGLYGWIRAGDIELTPPQWGRPLRAPDVRLIAAEFDPDKFGALCVWVRADGHLVIIDGQHRLQAVVAVLGWGDQTVPCLLYKNLTEREASELSLGLQDRRNLHPVDKHRTAIAAGHKRAMSVQNAVDVCGLELVRSGVGTGQVCAIDALGHAWDRLGEPGLIRVLRILADTWEAREGSITAKTIQLVGMMVSMYPDLDDRRLCITLGRYNAADWIVPTRSAPGRSLAHVAVDLVTAYNARLGERNKLPEVMPAKIRASYKRAPVGATRGAVISNALTRDGGGRVAPSRRRR